MESCRFSIVIPIYKVEKYMEECVESILAQTYKNFEIILVDDGSPDNCPKICDDYVKKDKRISVIHKENGGLSSARNAGLNKASGEYVIFLDSDDYYSSKNALEILNEKIEESSPEALFFQRKKFIDGKSTFKVSTPYPENKGENLFFMLAKNDKMDASAPLKATKREYLLKHQLYFKEGIYSEDVEWFFRYARHLTSIVLINDIFYCYRLRAGSITHTKTKKNIDDLFFSIENYAEKIRDSEIAAREALLNYLAYQYAIILGLINEFLCDAERIEMLNACKKYKWLTKFCISKKTKLSAFVINILGVNLASFILGKYLANK